MNMSRRQKASQVSQSPSCAQLALSTLVQIVAKGVEAGNGGYG